MGRTKCKENYNSDKNIYTYIYIFIDTYMAKSLFLIKIPSMSESSDILATTQGCFCQCSGYALNTK